FKSDVRSPIGAPSCHAFFAAAGGDVDNSAGTAAPQQRQTFLDAQKRAAQIDIDCRIPVLKCEIHERNIVAVLVAELVHAQCSVIDQNIEAAESVRGDFRNVPDIIGLRNIGSNEHRL